MARFPTGANRVVIDDLQDFIVKISSYAAGSPQLKCYRGQQSADWPTVPSLLRPDLARLERSEKRAVRELLSVHSEEFASDRSMFDRLVRTQHFGLPTRLLDS